MKTLGEAGDDVDDLSAWVNRNKKAEKKAKEQERLKAARLAKQLEEQVCKPGEILLCSLHFLVLPLLVEHPSMRPKISAAA